MDPYDYDRLFYLANLGKWSTFEKTIIFLLSIIAIALIIIIFKLYLSTQEKSKIDELDYTNEERESLKSKTKPETKVEASTKFEGELEEMPIVMLIKYLKSKKSKKDKGNGSTIFNGATIFIVICLILLLTIATSIVLNIQD